MVDELSDENVSSMPLPRPSPFFCSAVGSCGQQIPPSPAQSGTHASNTEHHHQTQEPKSVFLASWRPRISHSAPSEADVDWMPLHFQQFVGLRSVVCSQCRINRPRGGETGSCGKTRKLNGSTADVCMRNGLLLLFPSPAQHPTQPKSSPLTGRLLMGILQRH